MLDHYREKLILEDIIRGVLSFQKHGFEKRKNLFKELATGQNPKALFITCSDSRIDPNLLTDSEPGELFICRNAGNIVPPHTSATGGTTASIEYAVSVLGVADIIICGHSDCGAMKGVINSESLNKVPHVKEWLGHCANAKEQVKSKHEGCLTEYHIEELTQANVLSQLQHLRSHPCVAEKLANGEVHLHAWVYGIKNGQVNVYCEKSGSFIPFTSAYTNS